MTNKLNKKVNMQCPLCGKLHDVELRSTTSFSKIKGQDVEYEEMYYYCPTGLYGDHEFATGEMTNRNLLNARNAYRIANGLLTSDEIVGIREAYGLSQVDLARLLGWGEATISRYESKSIQDEAYDNILKLIRDNPLEAMELLEKNKDKFESEKLDIIRKNISDNISDYGTEYLTRQPLLAQYVDYNDKSVYNGYTLLDIEKLEVVISYFAKGVKNLFKTKLMKMIWYADSLSFKKESHSITGLIYIHQSHGALPIGHRSIMNLENLNVKDVLYYDYEAIQIYPSQNMDYSILSENEVEILDSVIDKFKDCDTAEIVNYMHEESAYIETNPGQIIPFSLASEIREF